MAAKGGSQLLNIILVALAALLYSRKDILVTFYKNAPSRMPQINALNDFHVRFSSVVRNCEDAYLNEAEGWALLSCDPGRDKWNTVMGTFIEPTAPPETGIYLYRYADSPSSAPVKVTLTNFPVDPRDFHPLGIEYHEASHTLFVVNHAYSGSRLELFSLDPAHPTTATHRSTLRHPLLHTPNSIAALGDSGREFLITNDHHFTRRTRPVLTLMETYLGFPRGNIAHVRLAPSGAADDDDVQVTVLAHLGFANGVAFLNDSAVAVSSSNSATVTVYDFSPAAPASSGAPTLRKASTIRLPFLPDNLSVDSAGTLLIAGHPHAPTLEKVAKGNAKCYGERAQGEGCPRAPSWVAEWNSRTGLRDLYAGSGFGSAVTAVRDLKRGVGIAVGLYERGILTWKA